MTTIDKILKIDDINTILQEIKDNEEGIDGLFVVCTTDAHEGYHARVRNIPNHILYGILEILALDTKHQCLDELEGDK